jgi:hypothetical protein
MVSIYFLMSTPFLEHSSHMEDLNDTLAMFAKRKAPKWNGTVNGPTSFPKIFLKINPSIITFYIK